MRIHRLCLHNWGQHTELSIEFPPTGVISLSGPNNSGKSTLLRAIGWVLSPNSKNRYGGRNDIQDGETSTSVTISFSLEDNFADPHQYLLKKEISFTEDSLQKNLAETKIELDGQPLLTAQWEEFLKREARLENPTQFLALMIAPQEEIHALLREPLGTRNKDLRASLGIPLPDFWNETLKDEITTWTERCALRAGSIDRALSDSDIRLQELHRLQEARELQLSELPPAEAIAEQIREIEQWIQQFQLYQTTQQEILDLTKQADDTERQKTAVRLQHLTRLNQLTPQASSSAGHSNPIYPLETANLDLQHAKALLRLMNLAECQQRLGRLEEQFQETSREASSPWPSSVEDKKNLLNSLQLEEQTLNRRGIQIEVLYQQVQKLRAQINPQYAKFEPEAQTLNAFYQPAIYHTANPELAHLRKIPLKEIKRGYELQLAIATNHLKEAKEKIDRQRQNLHLAPFTGPEAADLVQKIWENRTPEQTCVLTGSDLSHLTSNTVLEKAQAFRNKQLVTGTIIHPTNQQQDTHQPNDPLDQLAILEEKISILEKEILTHTTQFEPLLNAIDLLPSEKWLNISLEAIGTCLKHINQNITYRNQINQDLPDPAAIQAAAEADKKRQAALQEERSRLSQAIECQTLLESTSEEHKNKAAAFRSSTQITEDLPPIFKDLISLSHNQLEDHIQTFTRLIQSEEEIREQTKALEQRLHSLQHSLNIAQTKCDSLKEPLQTAGIALHNPDEITQLQTQKTNAAAKLTAIQQLQAVKTQTGQELENILSQRQKLRKEEEEALREKAKLQAAKDALDFLGPKRAPKQLLTLALQEIVEEANRILPETGLEMQLGITAEMDFQVTFERAQKQITEPARRLGCGLATLVGMCLKIALARILQPNLKFLAFDEPSAQLDAQKKQAFSQFLQSLSRQALTGNQILIIEHDLALAESCDCQIRLA